jgi:predicted amino acid racemase
MSKLPRVVINRAKLAHNFQTLQQRCLAAGITMTAVVKGLAGDRPAVDCLVAAGLEQLGDSSLANLAHFQEYPGLTKIQLRLPAPETAAATVRLAEVSLNSERATLTALNASAGIFGRKHQVILMVDLGDLREGVSEADLLPLAEHCRQLRHLEVVGLGANFSYQS